MNKALSTLSPLEQNKSASERVGLKLRALISSGNLAPGEKLPSENELARALQVSRPVVREALRGLSMMGVVESRQGGGCYVTDLNPSRLLEPISFYLGLEQHNLNETFDARSLIDGELAANAAKNCNDEQRQRLADLVRVGNELVADPIRFRVMDAEFHGLISESAGNGFLNRVSQALYYLAIDERRKASEQEGVLTQSARDHAAIVDAILAEDGEAARTAMQAHVRNIQRTTLVAAKELRFGLRDVDEL